jgi:hypothetical protein
MFLLQYLASLLPEEVIIGMYDAVRASMTEEEIGLVEMILEKELDVQCFLAENNTIIECENLSQRVRY